VDGQEAALVGGAGEVWLAGAAAVQPDAAGQKERGPWGAYRAIPWASWKASREA